MLGGISYGIAGRKRTERHIQSQGRPDLDDRLDRDEPQDPSLNPADLMCRDICSSRQLPKREARLQPRVAKLLTDPEERLRPQASRTVHALFPIRHARTLPEVAYPTITDVATIAE